MKKRESEPSICDDFDFDEIKFGDLKNKVKVGNEMFQTLKEVGIYHNHKTGGWGVAYEKAGIMATIKDFLTLEEALDFWRSPDDEKVQ
jgi:hypothetical protein